MKIYFLGGLLMVFVLLLKMWWQTRPWEEPMTVGLTSVAAGLVAYPIALALGTLSILLGLVQSRIVQRETLRVVFAIVYIVGAISFVSGLYLGIGSEAGWTVQLHFSTIAGLILLTVVLLLHMVKLIVSRGENRV